MIKKDRVNHHKVVFALGKRRKEKIICLKTIDSTNTYLKDLKFENAKEGLVVFANEQTSGRGRYGRMFFSAKDKGIYMSMLLQPECDPTEAVSITASAAVVICQVIEKIYNVKPGIKWVNDIVLNNKKVCGILTEMVVDSESCNRQKVILGIGINVSNNKEDFPEEIKDIASSLYLETGKSEKRAKILSEIIKGLDDMRKGFPNNKQFYLEEYANRCINIGKEVRFVREGKMLQALARGIDADFGLIVKYSDGKTESISSGEVSLYQ